MGRYNDLNGSGTTVRAFVRRVPGQRFALDPRVWRL